MSREITKLPHYVSDVTKRIGRGFDKFPARLGLYGILETGLFKGYNAYNEWLGQNVECYNNLVTRPGVGIHPKLIKNACYIVINKFSGRELGSLETSFYQVTRGPLFWLAIGIAVPAGLELIRQRRRTIGEQRMPRT